MASALTVEGAPVALAQADSHRGPWDGDRRPYRLLISVGDLRRHADPLLGELADDLRALGDVDHLSEQAWLDGGLVPPAVLWDADPALYALLLHETDLVFVVVERLLLAAHTGQPPFLWLTPPVAVVAAPEGLHLRGAAITRTAAQAAR